MSIRRPSNVPSSAISRPQNQGPNMDFLERLRKEMQEPMEPRKDSKGNNILNEEGRYILAPAVGIRKVTDDEMLTFPSEVFNILWAQRNAQGRTLAMVRQARYCTAFLDWSYDLAEAVDKLNSGVIDRLEVSEWHQWLVQEFKKDVNIVWRRANLRQLAKAFLEDQDAAIPEEPKVARELFAAQAEAAKPQATHAKRTAQGVPVDVTDDNEEAAFNEKVDESAWQEVFEKMVSMLNEAADEPTLERDAADLSQHLLIGKDSGILTPRQYAQYMHDLSVRSQLAKQNFATPVDKAASKLLQIQKAYEAGAITKEEFNRQYNDAKAQVKLMEARELHEAGKMTTDAYKRRIQAIAVEFKLVSEPTKEPAVAVHGDQAATMA